MKLKSQRIQSVEDFECHGNFQLLHVDNNIFHVGQNSIYVTDNILWSNLNFRKINSIISIGLEMEDYSTEVG